MRAKTAVVPMILVLSLVAGCSGVRDRIGNIGGKDDRVAFDGKSFRANVKKADRKDRANFTVTVRDARQSLNGAREAGRYEAVKYCIAEFGTSDITWSQGPDVPDAVLVFDKDTLIFVGTCTP